MEPKSPGYTGIPSDQRECRAWRAQINEMIDFLRNELPTDAPEHEPRPQYGLASKIKSSRGGSKKLIRRSSKVIRGYISYASKTATNNDNAKARFTRIVTDPELLRVKSNKESKIYAINWSSTILQEQGLLIAKRSNSEVSDFNTLHDADPPRVELRPQPAETKKARHRTRHFKEHLDEAACDEEDGQEIAHNSIRLGLPTMSSDELNVLPQVPSGAFRPFSSIHSSKSKLATKRLLEPGKSNLEEETCFRSTMLKSDMLPFTGEPGRQQLPPPSPLTQHPPSPPPHPPHLVTPEWSHRSFKLGIAEDITGACEDHICIRLPNSNEIVGQVDQDLTPSSSIVRFPLDPSSQSTQGVEPPQSSKSSTLDSNVSCQNASVKLSEAGTSRYSPHVSQESLASRPGSPSTRQKPPMTPARQQLASREASTQQKKQRDFEQARAVYIRAGQVVEVSTRTGSRASGLSGSPSHTRLMANKRQDYRPRVLSSKATRMISPKRKLESPPPVPPIPPFAYGMRQSNQLSDIVTLAEISPLTHTQMTSSAKRPMRTAYCSRGAQCEVKVQHRETQCNMERPSRYIYEDSAAAAAVHHLEARFAHQLAGINARTDAVEQLLADLVGRSHANLRNGEDRSVSNHEKCGDTHSLWAQGIAC